MLNLFNVNYNSILSPQTRENFENSGIDFHEKPLAEILLIGGFFLIYFLEEIVRLFCADALNSIHSHDSDAEKVPIKVDNGAGYGSRSNSNGNVK